ncbi:STAS domain-containing protein [Streptomyces alfalfae]|uniref:Anti-sigma factor antagonist n=1 Tax=Streptomyces alfalfae TaxID=1642299 RepID=A0A7T4PNG5_9ACTN|nr:STAS domain-containing protein [Streptomyces alfalfae]QQC93366.1 STAS domain-containing protein [Streptomyces alfalfae]
MSLLKITTRATATGPMLSITGDLEYDNASSLREALTTLSLEPGQRLILDLAGLQYCDSSGITAMIIAHHHARAAQADIALTAVPAHIARILRIVGLDQVFTLQADGDELV